MNKYLIIFAHPSHDGHHGFLKKKIEEKLQASQNEYEVIDLYQLNYNPVLQNEELYSAGRSNINDENKSFQDKISKANRLIFIYPTWWQGPPAILKGFIDRVFVSGFAFVYDKSLPKGLLSGKKAAVFTATGAPSFIFRYIMRSPSLKVITRYTLLFCGIKSRGFSLGQARKLEKNISQLESIANKMLVYLK
jgi:NAD(P)H dehydrogenase (quinone)